MPAQEPNTSATTIVERPGAELLTPVKDLPPVGYADRYPMPWSKRPVSAAVATVATIGWAVIALNRGETVNAAWLVLAAVGTYVIGHRFCGRLIEYNVIRPHDDRTTPAGHYSDNQNFMPTDRRVLFGHRSAAIASAGPLVGPIMATQMGYLPGTIRIAPGAVFAGAMQDYMVLAIPTRRRGRSFGQMINDEMGKVGGIFAIVGTLVVMTILVTVLGVVIVNALAESPQGVSSIAMTIPIAVFIDLYLRYIRPDRVSEVSIIGVILLMLAIIAGGWVNADPTWHDIFLWGKATLAWALIGYGFVASVLPVWLLLAPRDYLSTFVKIGVVGLLAVGTVLVSPNIQMPAITKFTLNGTGPAFAGELFPFLFITIVCGALPGFHSLVSSGTTPKLMKKESQMRMINYGGMIMESFVAVMATCAAVIIDQHLYFAMNASATLASGAADSATAYMNSLSLNSPDTDPAALTAAVQSVGEGSTVSRTGGAPTLAFGMSKILSDLFGGDALRALQYHFAIIFEALFILATVDASTHVARFILAGAIGNIPDLTKFRDASWTAGNLITSAVVYLDWDSVLVMGVTDPLGGINMLFPLFGIANQLLAAMVLTLVTVVVVKHDLVRWAWISGLPLTWGLIIIMTASWQKIFHDDPAISYWALHNAFKDTRAQGLAESKATKTAENIDAVIHNTAIQGTLSMVLAAVALMVVSAGIVAVVRALQNGAASSKDVGTSAEPYVVSRYFAPIGFVRADVEKEVESVWAEIPSDDPRRFQETAHSYARIRGH